jgi:YVTN family beta-propeller protein
MLGVSTFKCFLRSTETIVLKTIRLFLRCQPMGRSSSSDRGAKENLELPSRRLTRVGSAAQFAAVGSPSSLPCKQGLCRFTQISVGRTRICFIATSTHCEVTNKIYVVNELSNNVTVIDGATNSTTMGAGTNPNPA